jgi:hypothetical protein
MNHKKKRKKRQNRIKKQKHLRSLKKSRSIEYKMGGIAKLILMNQILKERELEEASSDDS